MKIKMDMIDIVNARSNHKRLCAERKRLKKKWLIALSWALVVLMMFVFTTKFIY